MVKVQAVVFKSLSTTDIFTTEIWKFHITSLQKINRKPCTLTKSIWGQNNKKSGRSKVKNWWRIGKHVFTEYMNTMFPSSTGYDPLWTSVSKISMRHPNTVSRGRTAHNTLPKRWRSIKSFYRKVDVAPKPRMFEIGNCHSSLSCVRKQLIEHTTICTHFSVVPGPSTKSWNRLLSIIYYYLSLVNSKVA